MTIATRFSGESEPDTDRAEKAAAEGPNFITQTLGQPAGVEDVAVEFPHTRDLAQGADFD
ncbi:hypothetical protein [Methylobacterium pseudosasicola]|uniref:Uncharacterized protein n=1 Tax=Methylobacterium pseudosasicola TaxID=582667 RepID=A0A1I4K6F7_9HYPH|nr:hypothetical protein [Methylobacterium pseudosasicola]SFL74036.1 hypothetical protein SAMN05192568_1009164 [Methylobacterium pseudosasicola]